MHVSLSLSSWLFFNPYSPSPLCDFHHSILFNKLKPWNSWSILTLDRDIQNLTNIYLINNSKLSNTTSIFDLSDNEYYTNIEISDLSRSLSSSIFTMSNYNKINYYQIKIYEYLNLFAYEKLIFLI
jgi:hypothetical protein